MIDSSKNVIIEHCTYSHTPGEIARSVFYYIQDIGYYKCGFGHITIREAMRSLLLIYTLNGKAFLHYRGKKYQAKAGDVFFINCRYPHVYGTDSNEHWEFKFIHFYGNNSNEIYETIYQMYGAIIRGKTNNPIIETINKLELLTKQRAKYLESQTMAGVAKLFSEIIQLSATRLGEIKNNKPNKIVDRAIRFIEKNYHTNIVLSDISEASCASKYHFSRIFKKIIGSSPYRYLINYRVNIAKEKLKQTSKSIAEIAVETGFESPSNFIKTFQSIEGVTPHNFRKIWVG